MSWSCCFAGCILQCIVAVCCAATYGVSMLFLQWVMESGGSGKKAGQQRRTYRRFQFWVGIIGLQAGGCCKRRYRTNGTELADKDSVTNLFSSWASSDAAYWRSRQPLYWREWRLRGNRWWPQCQPPPAWPVRGPPLSPEEESNLQRQKRWHQAKDTVGISRRSSTIPTAR